MNELTYLIAGISFDKQIKQNIKSKKIRKDVLIPEKRYYFYDFNNTDFSEDRLNEIKEMEMRHYDR